MIKSKSKTNSTTSKVIPKSIDDKESNCNYFGHIANQCPTRSNVKQVQTKQHDEIQNYLIETTQKGRMHKEIKINDHELQALIDTGSQLNLIRIDRYLAIGSPSFYADDRFISGNGNKRVKLLGKLKVEVKIDDVLFVTIFNIMPEDSMKVEVIIGDEMHFFTNDAEEALKRLKHVLKRAEEYGLQINWEKCQILKSEITYLGHEIKDGVIRPSDDKVAAVKIFPELKTIKQLQSFLGLTGYFRKFIKNYSILAKPLSDMLKTNANFMMGPDQKQAFQDLKHILTSKPVLKIYQVGARTELHTDASKFGFGAILLQEDRSSKQFKKLSEQLKRSSEQLKISSEQLKSYSETLRISSEKLKISSETQYLARNSRYLASNSRVLAENSRSNEQLKKSSEQLKSSSEKLKRFSEKLRISSEKLKSSSEKLKRSSEKLRISSEKLKRYSEQLEESSEKLRISSEKLKRSREMSNL
ncbi:hypothetical protein LAZ67_3002511 [Cordylochernes scorpioides]|uniref:Uncharacterized protein n=1 Tax=Cordylochernes scorpioides TaxID=51811 RepID=A0ABY6K847_9ARAC|nr:hypothetical protein LAZ67_3002511 [Cordylochernes scorpioides]